MKVAIQGLEASYHSVAARKMLGDNIDIVFCSTFQEVFQTLQSGTVEYGVVAIENSLYGSVNEVYDLLVKHHFWIQSEYYLHVGLQLLASQNAALASITDVYSQAPALAEAQMFLEKYLPKAERHEHSDTALAAKEVAEWQDETKAAIASQAAAKLYGLQILAKNIESHPDNYTRFIALASKEAAVSDATKTMLTLETKHIAGSLHKVLGVFAERGINLSKIESRPIIGKIWQHMYYIDFEAPMSSEISEELLKVASNIRVLGSFKKHGG